MGIVAILAGPWEVVARRLDLGESGGARCVVAVAGDAELARIGDHWFDIERPLHVWRGRTVAGLAAYAPVVACQPNFGLFRMAELTGLPSGILDRMGGNRVNGGCTVVTVFPEGRGYE